MNHWLFCAAASAFFAGLTAIFGKMGVIAISSNFATFIRTIIILGVSAAIVTYRQEWVRPSVISGRTLLFLVLSGIATGLSWLFYYRALQLGPASKVAPIDKLSVIFAVIMGVFFLGEPWSWRLLAGVLLIAGGSILVAMS